VYESAPCGFLLGLRRHGNGRAATASPASAGLCFSDLYADDTHSLDSILSQCDGDPLLLAGGPPAARP
jgi:hypothetical protein